MKKQLDNMGVSAFCESMAMMIHSGIRTDEALEQLAAGSGKKRGGPLEQSIAEMVKSMHEGKSLAQSMDETGIFPEYAIQMVKAGEQSGHLEDVMFRLARYFAERKELSDQIYGAITYPLSMICLIIAVLTAMLTLVLPAFANVYTNLTGSLAESGYGYIRWSYVVCWIALGLMLLLLLLICVGALLWRSGHRDIVERAISVFPICRRILEEMGLYRFSSSVVMFLASGEVQDEAVLRSLPMTQCKPVETQLQKVFDRMGEGRSFANAVAAEGLFEPVYTQMLLAGEKSGSLENILDHLSDLLRESYSHRIDKMVGYVNPILSGILIVAIGLSLISMMLPLIGMMNAVG